MTRQRHHWAIEHGEHTFGDRGVEAAHGFDGALEVHLVECIPEVGVGVLATRAVRGLAA
jgi:hypothetical protein